MENSKSDNCLLWNVWQKINIYMKQSNEVLYSIVFIILI